MNHIDNSDKSSLRRKPESVKQKLWVTVLLCAFFAAPVYAACTSPAGESGAIEWFSGTSQYKLCDGTTWNVIELDTTSLGACSPSAKREWDATEKAYKVCDGTTNYKKINCSLSGGTASTMKIAAGQYHSCGIQLDDTLWCWGYDLYSQLGDDATIANKSLPVIVAGGATWKAVAAGGYHSCGIKSDDTLWCWGDDTPNGQLGDDATLADKSTPVIVAGGATWKAVSAGIGHSCGIKSDDTLWCWGDDAYGQLGDDATLADKSTPVIVAGGATWKAVAGGGYHSCGIKSDDTLWCWGRDFFGQLGDDFTYADKSTPVIVADGATWKTVAAGSSHTCGIKSDDTLWCWGRDLFGQLGDGGLALNKLTPSPVTGGATWKAVAAGGEHSCGIKSDDTLWCWGADSYGQLGDDATLAAKLAPVIVAGGATWKTVTGGGEHSCGIKSDDTLWCWGSDIYGGLGDSIPTVKQPTPVAVAESDSFLSSTITYKTSGTTKGGASPWTVGGASFAMTTGDALMVCIATLGTVTGVTWNGTALTLNAQNNATVPYYSVYSLPNVTGATGDLVLTMSGTITAAVTAYSVTNLTSAPFDKQSGTTGTSTTPSSTAATTTQANEFLFGCIAANGPEIDGTWDAPFSAAPGTSAIATSGQGAASNIAVRTGYATVTATGSYLASMTGITSRDWAAAIATYKNNTNPVPCSCTWPVGSGTGCTSYGSCSTAAQMNYDATNGMLWCDGTNWRGMKAP